MSNDIKTTKNFSYEITTYNKDLPLKKEKLQDLITNARMWGGYTSDEGGLGSLFSDGKVALEDFLEEMVYNYSLDDCDGLENGKITVYIGEAEYAEFPYDKNTFFDVICEAFGDTYGYDSADVPEILDFIKEDVDNFQEKINKKFEENKSKLIHHNYDYIVTIDFNQKTQVSQ